MMRISANKKRSRREAYDSAAPNNSEGKKSETTPGYDAKPNESQHLVKEAQRSNAPGAPLGAAPPSVPPSLESKIGGPGCSMF